jgi:uncharacterized protein YdaU (DUF1376 family)
MATKARRESDELPWFKLYVREWLTRLLGVSLAAQGALIRLLCVSWDQRSLPNQSDACRRLAGADEREWRQIWPEITQHLEERDGALVSPWLELLRVEATADQAGRRLGAKKTNAKRWGAESLSDTLSESLSESPSEPLSVSLKGRYLRVQSSDQDSPLRGAPVRPGPDSKAVERVFDHWRKAWNHPKTILDPRRRRVIVRAFQLGFDETTLCRSIDGYKQSAFHCGQNDNRQVHDKISLLLRDAEHIEAGLQFAQGAANGKPPPEPMTAGELAQLAKFVESRRGSARTVDEIIRATPLQLRKDGWEQAVKSSYANHRPTLQ